LSPDRRIKVELHDVVAGDEHVVNLDRLTGKRDGKSLDIKLALIAHVTDGKIVEAWDLFSDQYAWDDFWL
jgi:ketosteroid isomerase-like protein